MWGIREFHSVDLDALATIIPSEDGWWPNRCPIQVCSAVQGFLTLLFEPALARKELVVEPKVKPRKQFAVLSVEAIKVVR